MRQDLLQRPVAKAVSRILNGLLRYPKCRRACNPPAGRRRQCQLQKPSNGEGRKLDGLLRYPKAKPVAKPMQVGGEKSLEPGSCQILQCHLQKPCEAGSVAYARA